MRFGRIRLRAQVEVPRARWSDTPPQKSGCPRTARAKRGHAQARGFRPLYKQTDGFELPSDLQRIVYTPYDDAGSRQMPLVHELRTNCRG